MGYGLQSDGLTFSEIESFCRLSDIELSRVEILALRRLSFDYINMLHKAKSKDLEPPYKLDKI